METKALHVDPKIEFIVEVDKESLIGTILPDYPDYIEEELPKSDEITPDYDIEIHPIVKELYKEFNINKPLSKSSIGESLYYKYDISKIRHFFFFRQEPVEFYHYLSGLVHNIYAHILYKLQQSKKIKLYTFDSSAKVANIYTNYNSTFPGVAHGNFAINFDGQDYILNISKPSASDREWTFYAKNINNLKKINKLLSDHVNKFNFYKFKSFYNDGTFINLPNRKLKDIYLPNKTKKLIQENILNYLNPKLLNIKRKNGIPTKRGIVFAGAPGTGKTFLCSIIAKQLKTTCMVINKLSYSWEVENIFKFSSMFENIVLIFEDIDLYVKDREQDNGVLSTLLNRLDGIEIKNNLIAICTTNYPNTLDKAMERPGRFDILIKFDSPDITLKSEMLKTYCKQASDKSKIDYDLIVKKVPKTYTGANLKELYILSCQKAIEENSIEKDKIVLNNHHFLSSIESNSSIEKQKTHVGFSNE